MSKLTGSEGQDAKMGAIEKGKLVDTKQLAGLLGVKEGWVRQNMRKIPHYKLGRLTRYDPKAVMERFKSG